MKRRVAFPSPVRLKVVSVPHISSGGPAEGQAFAILFCSNPFTNRATSFRGCLSSLDRARSCRTSLFLYFRINNLRTICEPYRRSAIAEKTRTPSGPYLAREGVNCSTRCRTCLRRVGGLWSPRLHRATPHGELAAPPIIAN